MLTAVAALLLLILLAATITVMDAVRAAHWRLVAVERRRSWDDRIAGDAAQDPQRPAWVRASAQ